MGWVIQAGVYTIPLGIANLVFLRVFSGLRAEYYREMLQRGLGTEVHLLLTCKAKLRVTSPRGDCLGSKQAGGVRELTPS